jgi:hypothetical protein
MPKIRAVIESSRVCGRTLVAGKAGSYVKVSHIFVVTNLKLTYL